MTDIIKLSYASAWQLPKTNLDKRIELRTKQDRIMTEARPASSILLLRKHIDTTFEQSGLKKKPKLKRKMRIKNKNEKKGGFRGLFFKTRSKLFQTMQF